MEVHFSFCEEEHVGAVDLGNKEMGWVDILPQNWLWWKSLIVPGCLRLGNSITKDYATIGGTMLTCIEFQR